MEENRHRNRPRRRVKRKRINYKRFFSVFFTVIFIIVLINFIKNLSIFDVKYIDITGNSQLNRETILTETGIKLGDNIFKISKRKSQRTLEKNPYIKSLEISKRYPNRIKIDIVENEEVYVLMRGTDRYILDSEWNVLSVNKNVRPNLIYIENLKLTEDLTQADIGKNIKDKIKSAGVINLIESNKDNDILDRFSRIDFSDDNNIIFRSDTGHIIEFGKLEDVGYKLDLLSEILDYITREEINYESISMNKGPNPIIVQGDPIINNSETEDEKDDSDEKDNIDDKEDTINTDENESDTE